MPSEDLRESRAVEGLQYRPVVVKLGKGGVEGDKKCIVYARMAYIMANGSNQKRQRVKGLQK
jgi:hypothetical protein